MIFQLVPGGLGLFGCFTFDGVPLFWLVLFCENVCFWNVSHVWPSWSLFALPFVSFWFSPSCFLSVPNSIAGKPDLSIDPSRRIDAKNSTSYSFSAPRNWIVKGLLSFVPRASFFFLCADRALIGGDVGRNGSRIRRRNGSHWRWILFVFFHFIFYCVHQRRRCVFVDGPSPAVQWRKPRRRRHGNAARPLYWFPTPIFPRASEARARENVCRKKN